MHNDNRIGLLRRNLERERAARRDAARQPGAPAFHWAEPFHEAWRAQAEDTPLVLRQARALAAEWAAMRPEILPGELVVGNRRLSSIVSAMPGPFSSGIRLDEALAQAMGAEHPDRAADIAALCAYWRHWFAENDYKPPMLMHASLAYERFIELGVDGVRRYVALWEARNTAADPGCAAWYRALHATLDGVAACIAAHADAAAEAAAEETDPLRRNELERIAADCRAVSHAAPSSFRSAVQLFYFLFWLNGHDSPGPVDRYLWPPLKRDLDRGAITLDEAQEIVDCLWLKFEEKTAYGATLGGVLPDGSDACNDLTRLCLNAIEHLRILSPRTAFRWHPRTDSATFDRAIDVIATGASYPALVNDEAMIRSMVDRGIAREHACDYSFVGCGQTYPHGRGHGNYEDVVANAALPVVLAINNGIDPETGLQAGPKTGLASELTSWEAFEAAYRAQLASYISGCIGAVNEYRAAHRGRWFHCLRSLVTYSCVERGRDWHDGGADYSEGMVDMVGLPTATDSLEAVRQVVYREGRATLAELRDALVSDWEGAEDLRRYCRFRVGKFGNGLDEVDDRAAAEVARVNRLIRSHRTVFGGPWGMDVVGWSGAVIMGRQTAATPDGRHRGEPLADCAGPAQGRNTEGLTATLRSVMKLPHGEVHGPLVLSLRFSENCVRSPESRRKLRAAIETYFVGGGQQLQISIAGTDVMKAAQRDPDTYADLIVRVGGFSAYFTRLEKAFQDDMIARAQMAV